MNKYKGFLVTKCSTSTCTSNVICSMAITAHRHAEAYIRAHEDNRKHSLSAFSGPWLRGSAGWIEANQYRSANNLYMILRFLPPGYFENCLLKV